MKTYPITFKGETTPNQGSKKNLGKIVAAGALGVGAIALALYLKKGIKKDVFEKRVFQNDLKYLTALANALSEKQTKITPEALTSVMGKEELLENLAKLEAKHFIREGNLADEIFRIDLNIHSNYANGKASVAQILEQAAQYANLFNLETKEKFIISIADHDSIESAKEAVKIIAQNPHKYRNIKFVPAIKLSFIHKADNTPTAFDCSEVIAHGINPFDKEINKYISDLYKKRESMITNALKDLSQKFPDTKFLQEEMEDYFIKTPNESYAYNLHWRVYNYAQIKYRITEMAKAQGRVPEDLYRELMLKFTVGTNERYPANFSKFLQQNKIEATGKEDYPEVKNVLGKYLPQETEGKITAESENTFEQIIKLFENNDNVTLGITQPYYFFAKFKNPQEEVKKLIQQSKGLIKTFENHYMAYPQDIAGKKEELSALKKFSAENNLLSIGGSNTYEEKLIP